MILRLDRLLIELPRPKNPSPNAAAAVQQLLGGKFGEMSTLMNYTYQSFNFRGRAGQSGHVRQDRRGAEHPVIGRLDRRPQRRRR
jgi:Mn-containing catalase